MVAEEYLIIVLAAIVGAIVANIEFALLGSPGAGGASVAQVAGGSLPGPAIAGTAAATLIIAAAWAGAIALDLNNGTERGERHFLLILGGSSRSPPAAVRSGWRSVR